jgi:type II secretory pathway pseudopilin PulG
MADLAAVCLSLMALRDEAERRKAQQSGAARSTATRTAPRRVTYPSVNRALTIWSDHPGTEATLHKQCWWRLRQYVQRVAI